MRKRFVVSAKNGAFIAGIYAERYEVDNKNRNSFNGSALGNFYIGDYLIASVELIQCDVADSSGILQETPWWIQKENYAALS